MIRFVSIIVFFLLVLQSAVGQTKYTAYHRQLAKKEKDEFKSACNELGAGRPYEKKDILGDKRKIAFLNEFYNSDLSVQDIARLKRKYKISLSLDSNNLGGAMQYKSGIYTRHSNLRADIIFTSYQNQVVYKSINLETASQSYCLDTKPAQHIGFSDVKYLEEHCFDIIDFPIKKSIFRFPYRIDTSLLHKLANLPNDKFKQFPADSTAMNRDIWIGVNEYKFGHILFSGKYMIQSVDTASLYRLLYSPNHIIALHAMEALIYLQESGKLTLPPGIVEKMEELKNSDFVFRTLNYDVGDFRTYKQVHMYNSAIVFKYKQYMALQ